MSWKEVSPGLFQRPLGETESGMVAAISAEKPYARELIKIHAFADLSSSQPTAQILDAFRVAWKALRLLKSPDIATMFKDGNNEYMVPSAQELENWLSRTFIVADIGTEVEEVVRRMQLQVEFLPVCYIIPRSSGSEAFQGTLILFVSHWRSEASGCYQMIGQLCDYASEEMTGKLTTEALANHVPGSEAKLLVPAVEEIVMPNKQSSPESQARMQAHFDRYYSHMPSIDLDLTVDPSTPFSNVLLRRHTFSPEATSAVVAACKAKGVTVTAAVHSAYIGAVRGIAPPNKQDRSYASLMPAQVRPRLPQSSIYRDQGCWAASQMLMLAVPAGLDFTAQAKSLRKQYGLASSEQWWFEDHRAVNEQMRLMSSKSPTEGTTAAAVPWFTSLGVLDREMLASQHGVITVENVWGWADPMGPGCVLTMWTFGEKLNIQITWNATFQPTSQIEQIMDLIDTSLGVELEVNVGSPSITSAKY